MDYISTKFDADSSSRSPLRTSKNIKTGKKLAKKTFWHPVTVTFDLIFFIYKLYSAPTWKNEHKVICGK